MSWKKLAKQNNYDEETVTLLEISVYFLSRFFNYSDMEASKYMENFLTFYSEDFDEEHLHIESSYRIAAIIHYLIGLKGERTNLQNWLVDNINNNRTPQEAIEYFRENYFEKT